MKKLGDYMKNKKQINRYTSLTLVMVIIFSGLLSRLAYLQIIKYEDNKEQANNQSVRLLSESAPRGQILSNDGTKLATSVQSYILTFIETEESKKDFFQTMSNVFTMLDENEEELQDTFALKVEPFRLEFNTSDEETIRALEMRFKKDRGFDFNVQNKLYPNQKSELTIEQTKEIDNELLNVTPEEMFYDLVKDKDYEIYKLLGYTKEEEKVLLKQKSGKEITELLIERYPIEIIRKYIVVKDAIKMQKFSGFKPITLATNIKKDSSFVFLQKLSQLPGVDVGVEPIRFYPYGEFASSVIGYVGSIEGGQKDKYEERGYDVSSDLIGKAGIESAFEDRLKGSKGGNTVKVNNYGRKTDELFKLESVPGQNIQLSLDKNLQNVAEQALEDKMKFLRANMHREYGLNTANATRAAVIVQDVNNGKVLAMVSNPGFNPNDMALPGRISPEIVKKYFAPDLEEFGNQYIKDRGLSVTLDELFPLVDKKNPKDKRRNDPYDIYPKATYNYATMGAVPPGSTYKPFTAAAGLESGVIDVDTKILDQGIFNKHEDLKNYTGACEIYSERGGSHGNIDLQEALAVSCNYYFYEIGYRLYKEFGLDGLAEYSWKFGLGKDPKSKTKSTTGIEIAEDTRGQVYNYESFKNLVSSLSAEPLVEILESGRSSRGNVFKPLPIRKNDEDTKDVAESKEVIKKLVKDELLKDYKLSEVSSLMSKFKPEMTKAINDYISKLPEEEKNQYKDTDIEAMVVSITSFIYYDKRGELTTGAEVINASIGQGMSSFTPLQLNNAIATLVNGGTRYKTTLIDKITDSDGKVLEETKPQVTEELNLKESTVATIKEGMRKVDETGTATSVFRDFPIVTGGKTGTATYRANGEQEKVGRSAYGVYVGFAPFDKPEIAVTVIVYDGGHGYYGADVVKAVYEEYFRDRILAERPNYTFMYDYTLKESKSLLELDKEK
ncbi:penicillin-binding protein 2 [Clostridium algidicarnis DSM 15099]|uniref:Penicillin-binding protein 2 n=2 Tax=Clostridium algidicarnis TaxID=37659 RepID=A0A2S6FWT4_9CLOT|nr:penicillin-binding protein 2 [Clostridium algidicarnis DSM 15099]